MCLIRYVIQLALCRCFPLIMAIPPGFLIPANILSTMSLYLFLVQ